MLVWKYVTKLSELHSPEVYFERGLPGWVGYVWTWMTAVTTGCLSAHGLQDELMQIPELPVDGVAFGGWSISGESRN